MNMVSRSMSTWLRKIATILSCTVLLLSASQASAITDVADPPIHQTLDGNGVDVTTGQFNYSSTDVSIGSGIGLMTYVRSWQTTRYGDYAGWRDNLTVTLDGSPNNPVVNMGDVSEAFTKSGSDFIADQGSGSTLTLSGTTYTYTSSSGTAVVFVPIPSNNSDPYSTNMTWADRVVYPNGVTWKFSYKAGAYCVSFTSSCSNQAIAYRLQSVTSNMGYQLKIEHARDAMPNLNQLYDWHRITKVIGINNAIEYCDPSADTCSLGQAWPSVSYALTYTYNTGFEASTDASGSVTNFTFDSGKIVGISRPGTASGYNISTTHSDGMVTQVVTDGTTWNYSWTDSGSQRTMVMTGPASLQRTVISDTVGLLVQSDKDAFNRTIGYAYDGNGRVTNVTAPEGNRTEYVYDGRGNVTFVISHPKGEANHPAGSPYPGDIYTQADFPSTCANPKTCNQPTWTRDARQKQTDFTYDNTHGGMLTATAPAVTVNASTIRPQTRYEYTSVSSPYASGGTIWLQTAVSSCQTTSSCSGTADEARKGTNYYGYQWNFLPGVLWAGSGANSTMTQTYDIAYDNVRNLVASTNAVGQRSYGFYDANRRSIGTISEDPDGGSGLKRRAMRVNYRPDGQVFKIEQGTAEGVAKSDLDAMIVLKRVERDIDANARVISESIFPRSGPQLAMVQYSYDAAGRLECTAQRMNPATYGALPGGCSLASQGADGPDRISRTFYDAVGQITDVQNAIGTDVGQTTVHYTYSNNGKVTSLTDAKSNVTGYTYDGFDRPKRTCYLANAAACAVSPSDYEEITYDDASRVTYKRQRDGQSIGYGYDDLNRLLGTSLPGSPLNANATFKYDLLGRTTWAENGNGVFSTQIVSNFDALGRKVDERTRYGWANEKIVYFEYDAAGRRTKMTYPDGFWIDYLYNNLNEPTFIREYGSPTLPQTLVSFGYDDLGHRVGMGRGNGQSTNYVFDDLSRLLCLAHDIVGGGSLNCAPLAASGSDYAIGLTYNPASQIKSRSSANDAYAWTQAYNVNRSYTSNGLNQYTQINSSGTINPTYDARGNLTSAGSNAYIYNILNQLVGANGMRLDYDALGRLTYSSGSHTRFLYDGPNLIAEYDDAGNMIRRYIHGPGTDEPLVWYEGSGTGDRRWLHADERGSVIALTDVNGGKIAINSYDPWGIPQTTNLGRFQYTGQLWMPELGLYYYKARFYSATLGRFLQTDPIGYADGPNWYAYVGNDPINLTDPTGLDACGDGSSDICATGQNTPDYYPGTFDVGGAAPLGFFDGSGNCLNCIDARKASVQQLRASIEHYKGYYRGAQWVPVDPLKLMFGMNLFQTTLLVAASPIALETISAIEALGVSTAGSGSYIPQSLARVIPGDVQATTLGAPTATDVFVTTPEAISGLDAAAIAQRLTIPKSPSGFQIIRFPTPSEGLASPILRTNPGFVGRGVTAGGAPEYVIPNGPIPAGAIITRVP